MPAYNIYISDEKVELIDALNKLKSERKLAEFMVESCEINLPLYLERKRDDAKRELEYWEEVETSLKDRKRSFEKEKWNKRNKFLKTLPRNASLGTLSGPAWMKEWKRAGFTSEKEVLECYEEFKETEELTKT